MAESPPDVTLTAGVSGQTPADTGAADLAPGVQVGRYRLERVLGAGGMGVVWAAHDPDLDREVALKVLRAGDGAPARRVRLLREARAMAKVHHPNVITVHEVGTADGRDFVAMEIVHGKTVAQWMRTQQRKPHSDVRRVFVAAGRGLAAAHAVGLVHRDFKPHNILVDDEGRVVVTDFGLARATADAHAEVEGTPPEPRKPTRVSGLEQTVDATSPIAMTSSTPRDIATLDAALTEAGALLGTPAYMAPEQIDGAPAGPRADQFAYCVALWEAWCGERPFRGSNVLELRKAIDRPPTGGGALPRRMRSVLRRGLDPDPNKRWPDMAALLRALERAERRPWWIATAAAAALIAIAVTAYVVAHRGAARASIAECAPIVEGPRALHLDGVAAPSAATATALQTFERGYFASLESACTEGNEDVARATCLGGEARLALAVFGGGERAIARHVAPDYASFVPATSTCYADPPPSIPHASGAAAVKETALRERGFEIRLRAEASDTKGLVDDAEALVTEARASGSCVALAEAQLAHADALVSSGFYGTSGDAYEEAAGTAETCHHDRVRAAAALAALQLAAMLQPDRDRIVALRASAVAAVDRAGKDPMMVARVSMIDGLWEGHQGDVDKSIQDMRAALSVFEDRHAYGAAAGAARTLAELLVFRGGSGDLAGAAEIAARVAKLVEDGLGWSDPRTVAMQRAEMLVAWKRGYRDVVAALRSRVSAHPDQSTPIMGSAPVSGQVVDGSGVPVAHAEVVAGVIVIGDESSLDMSGGAADEIAAARTATTADDGTFTIADVPPGSWVVAQAPDGQRSLPLPTADAGNLTVGPTSKVTGKIDLGSTRASSVVIDAVPAGPRPSVWSQQAPIADDGSFTLDHLARGRWTIRVRDGIGFQFGAVATEVVVDRPEIDGVTMVLERGKEKLDVIVRADRDTTIPLAQILAMPGRFSPHSLGALLAAARANVSVRNVMAQRASRTDEKVGDLKLERGDLYGSIKGLAEGETTVCAIPFGSDTMEPSGFAALYQHANEVEVYCRTINVPDDGAQLFAVAPAKRIQ